jgi:dolichol-phosphate mannosyltransferase
MSSAARALSIVVPVFNEAGCLPELHRRLRVLDSLPNPHEILFVDDGSTDPSFQVIAGLAAADARVRGLSLMHNVGSQRALWCGMRAARGDAVITLDADLQHPPEMVPAMVDAWQRGHGLVECVRRSAPSDGPLRDLLTPLFYRAFNALSPVPLDPASTDFRLLDRRWLAHCHDRPGELVRVTIGRLDAPRAQLPFDVADRFAGRSRYDLARLGRFAVTALWGALTARFGDSHASRAPLAIAHTVGTGL